MWFNFTRKLQYDFVAVKSLKFSTGHTIASLTPRKLKDKVCWYTKQLHSLDLMNAVGFNHVCTLTIRERAGVRKRQRGKREADREEKERQIERERERWMKWF